MKRTLLLLTLLPAFLWAQPDLAAFFQENPLQGGWAMHLGSSDGQLESELLSHNFRVTGVMPPGEDAQKLRETLLNQGLLGNIHIYENIDPETIPAKTDSLTLIIVDLDTYAISEKEIRKKLAPFGKALVRKQGSWKTWHKELPEGYDHWTHYDYGANSNDFSKDQHAGYARGVQWIGGPFGNDGGMGIRVSNGVSISIESPHFARGNITLTARDAFNGAVLWQKTQVNPRGERPFRPDSRYALFCDEERVFVHWASEPHLKAYDLRTGEELMTYDQGFNINEYEQATWFRKGKSRGYRGEPARMLVANGVLIQAYMHRIYALDVNTGKRLWLQEDESKTYNRPLVQGGTLVILEGGAEEKFRKSANYFSDSELFYTNAVVGLDLRSGKAQWRHENAWKETHPSVRNLASADGIVAVLFEIGDKEKYEIKRGNPQKSHHVLVLDAASGEKQFSRDDWGSGYHHQKRVAVGNGTVWAMDTKQVKGWRLDSPDSSTQLKNKAFSANPLWGCSLPRLTPNGVTWWLSGESFLDGSRSLSHASRNGCDMGSVPAHGLLYQTPNHGCGCYGFIGRHSAFYHRPLSSPFSGTRLVKGSGRPATNGRSHFAETEWPMYLKDPMRSSWSSTKLGDSLQVTWTQSPLKSTPAWAELLEHTQAKERLGPVTPVTVAEGVLALGSYDTHEVIVLDPESGSVRWRRALDGRIDSPPTIYNGAVYVGTRSGWIYALNRDSGEFIWKFFASATPELILANWGSENAQPAIGTVSVVDGLVWVNAGRHVEIDHGVTWWALDPATGEVAKEGMLKPGSEGRWARQTGQNTPWVSDGEHIVLHRAGLKVASGEPAIPGTDWNTGVSSYGYEHHATSQLLMSNYSTLHRGDIRWESSRQGRTWHVYGVGGSHIAYNGKGETIGLAAVSNAGGRRAMGDGRGYSGTVSRWKRRPEKLEGKALKESESRASTATEQWKTNLQVRRLQKSKAFTGYGIAVAGEKVLALTSDTRNHHALEVYNKDDGSFLQSIELPGHPVNCGLAVANGAVYITLLDGHVLCLR